VFKSAVLFYKKQKEKNFVTFGKIFRLQKSLEKKKSVDLLIEKNINS
jgi:hypothetical protein